MRTIMVIGILILILLGRESVEACQCMVASGEISPEQAREWLIEDVHKASAVFVGEIISMDATAIKFKVSRVWKGSVFGEDATLLVGRRSETGNGIEISDCEYQGFKKVERYLVFAYEVGGELFTDKCTRTKLKSAAEVEIKSLNELFGGEAKSNKSFNRTRPTMPLIGKVSSGRLS